MTPHVASKRAGRGAALLDRKSPGWHKRADVPLLCLWSTLLCPLGQEFGSYQAGLKRLKISPSQSVTLGFYYDDDLNENDDGYELLRQAWVGEIGARVGGKNGAL